MKTDDLDRLLAAAAERRPDASPALIDRVLADAYALQPQAASASSTLAPPRQALLSRLAGLFGGGPVLAGVFSAAIAGVALGYTNPTTLDYLTGGLTTGLTGGETDALDLFPSTDFLTIEG